MHTGKAVGAAVVEGRLARFDDLKPIANQRDPTIPQAALDIVYSRQLLPVIGLEANEETPVSSNAPILGAAGMTMTYAVCPPGQGPDLHTHKRTFETFTVLEGVFEFRWGDDGEHKTRLERFDVLSFPPGVARAFTNVGEESGVLQVIITGGLHDMKDVHMPSRVARKLKDASPALYDRLIGSGVTFDAI